MSDIELEKLLANHQGELKSIAAAVADGDRGKIVDEVAGLVAALATGNPLVGALAPFARRAVARAFGSSADEVLRMELAAMEKDEERARFLGQIDEVLAALVGQALIQIVSSQHRVKDELLAALGGVRHDFEGFRRNFEQGLRDDAPGIVHIDEQLVNEGAIGIRVRETTTRKITLHRQVVSGRGSVGLDLK